MQRLRDYLLALCICVAAFAVYRVALVPYLEPAESPAFSYDTGAPPMAPLDPQIAKLLPADSWQLGTPRQLASEAGMILFENSEQVNSSEWKLWPVTFIAHGTNNSRPLMLDAPEGAKIQFNGSLDALASDQSPIGGGQLLGNVRMMSPATNPDADDAIHVEASNVWINHREIKTADFVRIKLGSAEAIGRDLTVHLSGSSSGATPAVDRMELIYLDHLQMPLRDGGLWQPLASPAPGTPERLPRPGESAVAAMLRIDCQGRLEFNFQSFTMLLQGREVLVSHQINGYPVDTIRCQRLEMQLFNPEIPVEDRPAWARVVRRIEAIGTPVKLDAPSLLSHAVADKLLIDFQHSATETSIDLTGATPVELGHRGMVLRVPSLTYRFFHQDPQRLGSLLAAGGGTMTADPSAESMFRRLSWSGRLQLLPEKDAHLLWMDGGVDGEATDGGKVHSDALHFWFAQKSADSLPGNPENSATTMTLEPQRLRLSGQVDFALTQLAAKQESIDLWFKQVKLPLDANGKVVANQSILLNRASGMPQRQPVHEPRGAGSSNKTNATEQIAPPRLISQTLSGELHVAGQTIVGYDLSARKQVRLEYESLTKTGRQRLMVTGDELRAVDTQEASALQVNGGPARIEADDGFVQGPMIQANIRENYLWIDRDGELRVPSSMLEQRPTIAEKSSWHWTIAPSLRFKGSLIFNGTTMEATTVEIRGSGRSEPTGPVWQLASRSDLLRMTMSQPVNFQQFSSTETVSPRLVSLIGTVAIDASSWLGETRESRHRLELPQLDVEPGTGLLSGAPGQYRMWSARDSTSGGALPDLVGDSPLTTAHLIYHEQMRGDLNAKRLDFNRAVRVGIGPTQSWDQSIDVSRIEVPTPGQSIIDCDQLSLYQAPSGPSTVQLQTPWEIAGLGGVAFRGHAEAGIFSGTCNRFNYASSKDLLTLEGQPTAPAVFVRQLPSGAPGGEVRAFSLSVRPRSLEVIDFQLQGANFSNLQEGFNLPPAAQADPAKRRRNF